MEADPPRDERVIKIFKEVRQSPLGAMGTGIGVKSELKDFGELFTYFDRRKVPVQESVMTLLLFKNPFKNKNDPLIEEFRNDLEKQYEGIKVQPKTTEDGQVYGLTIWRDVKRGQVLSEESAP